MESVVSTPNLVKLDPPKLERRSSFNGNVRADINTRITNALQTIREKIPTAVDSVEDDIAIANRDKVILALANFLGSKSFKKIRQIASYQKYRKTKSIWWVIFKLKIRLKNSPNLLFISLIEQKPC